MEAEVGRSVEASGYLRGGCLDRYPSHPLGHLEKAIRGAAGSAKTGPRSPEQTGKGNDQCLDTIRILKYGKCPGFFKVAVGLRISANLQMSVPIRVPGLVVVLDTVRPRGARESEFEPLPLHDGLGRRDVDVVEPNPRVVAVVGP